MPFPSAGSSILGGVTTPVEHVVGARIGLWHGGGRLVITPGRLILRPNRVTRWATSIAELVHTAESVNVVTSVFIPPWFNVRIVFEGSDAEASIPIWLRATVIRELSAAGFEVRVQRRWVWTGG